MSQEHHQGCIPSRIMSPWLSSSLGEVRMHMSITRKRAIGWSLVVLGVWIAVLCQKIVFPGLEALLGIETTVGRENVVYEPDGSYMFTNPGATRSRGLALKQAHWDPGSLLGANRSAVFLSEES
jgi:hypothetical protein